jgi:hypothetical protein
MALTAAWVERSGAWTAERLVARKKDRRIDRIEDEAAAAAKEAERTEQRLRFPPRQEARRWGDGPRTTGHHRCTTSVPVARVGTHPRGRVSPEYAVLIRKPGRRG